MMEGITMNIFTVEADVATKLATGNYNTTMCLPSQKPLSLDAESHTHDLSPTQVQWILNKYSGLSEFNISMVTLPLDTPPVKSALHADVPEDECFYAVRPGRKCASRLCRRPALLTHLVTVIYGPLSKEDPTMVLYTVFGGGQSPREPGDHDIEDLNELQASRKFWATHALSAE